MNMSLDTVPRKLTSVSRPGLGLTYPEAYELYTKLAEQDPTMLFYALRPIADELWNMIDGERSVGRIIESCMFEFDFDVDPSLFLPAFEALESNGLIAADA
jgi:hypothetical protein